MAAKKRKSNRNNRAGKICISMILVVFAAAMSVQIVKAYQKDQEYAVKQEQLEAQLEDETARQEELQNYQSYTQSQEYVEDIAKSKLGLAYDNEIIFKEETKEHKNDRIKGALPGEIIPDKASFLTKV